MRDSRLFDSVVGYASHPSDEPPPKDRLDETEDPWRLSEIESERDHPDPRLGQRIGSIRLDSQVGRGGMGTVFEGWDEKLQRKVAVKAISRHYRSNVEARERFLREARLLSKLQHPNICQIHDHVEGPDGDYLILELVHGRCLRSILEDGETFSHQDGLRIALQLSAALMAAHDQGVAHRDLKPGNVMITPNGTVKVLDFGLGLSVERAVEKGSAKAGLLWTESGSIERSAIRKPVATEDDDVTVLGGRRDTRHSHDRTSTGSIEGTLAYMSPEQARSEPAGTASDIYSLGLVLQEIFTGRGAYPADLPVTNQLVRAGQGDTLPAAGIDSDLARLIQRMKSIAPGSRPSAPDVAERLRWIADKPKRRLRAGALAAFVVLLVAFSAVMGYQRLRIAEEAERANREAESARQVTEYLKSVFEVADPWNAETVDISARELLQRGTERIRTELESQPLIRARLLTTMGEVNRRLGYYRQAEPLLEESLNLQQERGADPRDLASTMTARAMLQSDLGHYDVAVDGFREAVEIQRAYLSSEDPDLAYSVLNLGCALHYLGELDEAEDFYAEALEMYEATSGPGSLETADVLSQLALTRTQMGRFDEAGEFHRRALAIREQLLPPSHPDLGVSYGNLAAHHYRQGQFEEAARLFRRDLEISEAALGPDHPDLSYSQSNLSATLRQLGDYEAAAMHARRSLEIREQANDEEHAGIAAGLSRLAVISLELGKVEEALPLFLEATRIRRRVHDDQDPNLASSLLSLAAAYQSTSRHGEAAVLGREALEIRIEHFGAEHLETARARLVLGRILFALDELEGARRQLRQASAVAEAEVEKKPGDQLSRHVLAESLTALARLESPLSGVTPSARRLARAVALLEPLVRESDAVRYRESLIQALLLSDRAQEAEPLARDLLERGLRRPDFVDLCREQGWVDG